MPGFISGAGCITVYTQFRSLYIILIEFYVLILNPVL